MSRLISRLTGQRFYDVSCGMRCYSRRAALQLHLLGALHLHAGGLPQPRLQAAADRRGADPRARRARVRREPRRRRACGATRCAPRRSSSAPTATTGRCASSAASRSRCCVPARGSAASSSSTTSRPAQFRRTSGRASAPARCRRWRCWCSTSGVIGDMLNRHRVYLEELLFRQRSDSRRGSDSGALKSPAAGMGGGEQAQPSAFSA